MAKYTRCGNAITLARRIFGQVYPSRKFVKQTSRGNSMAFVVKRTIVGAFPTGTRRGIAAEFSLSQVQGRLSLAFRGLVEVSLLPSCQQTGTTVHALLTYLLTPWSRVLLEKLTGSAASQEITRIFGTRRFITVPTSARHLSLS